MAGGGSTETGIVFEAQIYQFVWDYLKLEPQPDGFFEKDDHLTPNPIALEKKSLKFEVETYLRKKFTVYADPNDTIESFKKKIANLVQIPYENQKIFLGGKKELNNIKTQKGKPATVNTFRTLDVKSESILYIIPTTFPPLRKTITYKSGKTKVVEYLFHAVSNFENGESAKYDMYTEYIDKNGRRVQFLFEMKFQTIGGSTTEKVNKYVKWLMQRFIPNLIIFTNDENKFMDQFKKDFKENKLFKGKLMLVHQRDCYGNVLNAIEEGRENGDPHKTVIGRFKKLVDKFAMPKNTKKPLKNTRMQRVVDIEIPSDDDE